MASKTNIDIILQKYKTPDKWLGTRATASFEAEVVKYLDLIDEIGMYEAMKKVQEA